MPAFSSSASAKGKSKQPESRLIVDYLLDSASIEHQDRQEVGNGLQHSPKFLPARFFYDANGSQLFEQICDLPEYYPTRTEAKILQNCAAEIAEHAQVTRLIELGSGSSTKTRHLLDVYHPNDSKFNNRPFYYEPIDVSDSILRESALNLLEDYSHLKIHGRVATYSQALTRIAQGVDDSSKMIMFLGSSIGNFGADACDCFMAKIVTALNPGDYFLLGIDLQKPVSVLEAAYNDSQNITAAFNLNMLQHLNQRFTGNFNSSQFRHQAIYNQSQHQIEMYLISQQQQIVTLKELGITIELQSGEKILTEVSRKFDLTRMKQDLTNLNLQVIQAYTDPKDWFALLLCQL